MPGHQSVLLKEVLEYLNPQPGQNFIDCTLGGGGHTLAILERIKPGGRILGIEADDESLENFKLQIANFKLRNNLILVNDNFRNLKKIYEQFFPYQVDGILFDLGLSSMELEDSGRGFSFLRDEPLDMRMNLAKQRLTAAEILNKYSIRKLAEIFYQYGEIGFFKAKKIAEEIEKVRGKKRFERTTDLLEIIGEKDKKDRIHPATLFFQALRIEVNEELVVLEEALPQAFNLLRDGGELAVISFHSLEDRIVKNFFRNKFRADEADLRTKKPIGASAEEIVANPRSRSAKMRVAKKMIERIK